jgi:hypothetical protein
MTKIITPETPSKNETESFVTNFMTRFNVAKLTKSANFKRSKGLTFKTLMTIMLSAMFANESLYRYFQQFSGVLPCSTKTVRNFLNTANINWTQLQIKLVTKVIKFISPLTSEERKTTLIFDDTMYARPNAKDVELAAWQYDHANHKHIKGFRMLQCAWSDGDTVLPVEQVMLSAARKVRNAENLDMRTIAAKRRVLAQLKGPDAVIESIKHTQAAGISTDYVLFDTWFASPKMFKNVRELGLNAIAMLKRSKKVYYEFNGHRTDVNSIFKASKKRRGRSRYLLSVDVTATSEDTTIPMKLVYIRNRNKRNEYIVLGSTDTTLSEDEIIQLYGRRWHIEGYFKVCKQYLRLTHYQGTSYDGISAYVSFVAIAYLMLAVKQRESADDRTIGDLFFMMIQELPDISFAEALSDLLSLLEDSLKADGVYADKLIDSIVDKFVSKLPMTLQKAMMQVA